MSDAPTGGAEIEVTWLGHATADVSLGGVRVLTDPVLRDRVAHLRRHSDAAVLAPGSIDAVVRSHLHHDHLDIPSLRRLPAGTPLIVPKGSAKLVARAAPGDVVEMVPGDEIDVNGMRITAVSADHRPNRTLRRVSGQPIGFVLEKDGGVVYFPGDTDLHEMMADLPAPDVALLPIWGWGRTLGPGHLDPQRAAQAAALLRAGMVLPIHWGTFAPVALRSAAPEWLSKPADEFRTAMDRHSPDTVVSLVLPGSGPVRVAVQR